MALEWDVPTAVWFTSALTVFIQLACFAIAYKMSFDKITDFSGSTNFTVIVLLSVLAGGYGYLRPWLAVAMVVLSRTQLGFFLLLRVMKRGHDARFDDIRTKFFPFLAFWVFQMLWIICCCMPVVIVAAEPMDPDMGVSDYVGIALFAVGLLVQGLADAQKYRFRADPANKGKFCDVGVWGISRHPNYFGEVLLWWGIYVTCLPALNASGHDWAHVGIISPLFTMFILFFGSGMPGAERDSNVRYGKAGALDPAGYRAYRHRVSIFVPLPQCLYASLPQLIKAALLCEWPMYAFREEEGQRQGAGGGVADGAGGGYGTTNPAAGVASAGEAAPADASAV